MRIQNKLNLHGGEFARPTRYTVMVMRPPLLQTGEEESVDIMCKAINIPETTHTPVEMTFKGHPVKVPGRTNQAQTVSMTFYLDESYNTRRIFQDWIDFLDPRFYAGNTPAPDYNFEKYGSIVVYARDYNETGDIVEEFNFEKAFPLSISDLEYSAADKDAIMEFTVTFAYYRMVNNPWIQGMLDSSDSNLDNFGMSQQLGSSTDRFPNSGANEIVSKLDSKVRGAK